MVSGSLCGLMELASITRRMTESLGRYTPFLRRQEADLKVFHEDEDLVLDPHMDYSGVVGISSEVKEKLAAIKPTTIVGVQLRSAREVFMCTAGCCKANGRDDAEFRGIVAQVRKAETGAWYWSVLAQYTPNVPGLLFTDDPC